MNIYINTFTYVYTLTLVAAAPEEGRVQGLRLVLRASNPCPSDFRTSDLSLYGFRSSSAVYIYIYVYIYIRLYKWFKYCHIFSRCEFCLLGWTFFLFSLGSCYGSVLFRSYDLSFYSFRDWTAVRWSFCGLVGFIQNAAKYTNICIYIFLCSLGSWPFSLGSCLSWRNSKSF